VPDLAIQTPGPARRAERYVTQNQWFTLYLHAICVDDGACGFVRPFQIIQNFERLVHVFPREWRCD
jgi:hypothetical protein